MVLPIAAALKQPGEAFSARMQETFPPQEFGGREIAFLAPVTVAFTYSFDGEAFNLRGRIGAVLSSQCARCSEPFAEPLEIPFAERFVKGAADPDDDSYAFEGESMDIRPMVMDNLFLNMPIRSVCREDCKGLCPVCGCNLNTAQCSCAPEVPVEEPSPLAALGSLFDDGKEV